MSNDIPTRDPFVWNSSPSVVSSPSGAASINHGQFADPNIDGDYSDSTDESFDIDEANVSIEEIKDKIVNLKDLISTLTDTLEEVVSMVDDIESDVETLESNIDNYND